MNTDNTNSKNFYNKYGFYFFLATLGFSCLWAVYFLVFNNSIDLGEYDKLVEQAQTEALNEMEKAKPWIATENLIAYGNKVYTAQCALCHGSKGLGDGTPGLIPPPRNLVEGKWRLGGSSKDLFLTLQKGIEGSSMVSFKHLSKLDRWALVHYIRSITNNKVSDNEKNWKNLPVKLFSFLAISLFLWISSFGSLAEKSYRADETPHPLKNITVKERLGDPIDLNLVFFNEQNQSLALKEYFGSAPVLMTVIYYNCPSLCNFHLNGLFEGFEKLASDWTAPYQFVLVSMDSTEKSSLAKEKKSNYLKKFKGLKGKNIHFLTGSEKSIKKLTESLGFSFRWMKRHSNLLTIL